MAQDQFLPDSLGPHESELCLPSLEVPLDVLFPYRYVLFCVDIHLLDAACFDRHVIVSGCS